MNHLEKCKYKYKYYKYLYKLNGGMKHPSPGKINIVIKNIFPSVHTDTEWSFFIDRNTKVETLMKQLVDKTGIPIDKQRLIYKGKELSKIDQTLESYGVVNGDNIFIIKVSNKGNLSNPTATVRRMSRLMTDPLMKKEPLRELTLYKPLSTRHLKRVEPPCLTCELATGPKGEADVALQKNDYLPYEKKSRLKMKMKMPLKLINTQNRSRTRVKSRLTDRLLLDKSLPHISNSVRGFLGDDYVSPQSGDKLKEEVNNTRQLLKPINITINTNRGKNLPFTVSPAITVGKLMLLYSERDNFDVDLQSLFFGDISLDPRRTLFSYGIVNNSVIDDESLYT